MSTMANELSSSWLDRICLLKKRDDPKSHTRLEKNVIVLVVTLSAFTAPFASTILFPSFSTLVLHFHTSDTIVALTTTVFLIGLAIAPLWWSSLKPGVRPATHPSYQFYNLRNCSVGLRGV